MVRDLPGGGQVIAQDMGGITKTIIIIKPRQGEEPEPLGPEIAPYDGHTEIPILYSGRVLTPRLRSGEVVKVQLTGATLRRLRGYDDEKPDGAAEQSLHRFNIPYPDALQVLNVESPIFTDTQYNQAHPTWWSGAMGEVVQIVSGFGIQDNAQLPENERTRLRIPERVLTLMQQETEHINAILPGYTGVPPKDGKIQYNFQSFQTDVVSFDAKGRPWLVRIGADGVYAMPLPMIPATTTKAFKKWMGAEEDWSVDDAEIMHILERFGGLPSGEPMPCGSALHAWRRAGVIVKVCDSGGFHKHIPYSTACGWSVNTKGTEGYFTCYDYADDGFCVGYTYKLRLNLGAADFDGKLPRGLQVDGPEQQTLLNNYLLSLYEQLREPSAKNLAIKYKLRRAGAEAILARAANGEGAGDVDYWDNLEQEPIAMHSGSITLVSEGPLYHPAKKEFQPQIKFPDLTMKGCISFDFTPQRESETRAEPKCNTIMFAYYAGDNLKTVRYLYDPRVGKGSEMDDEQPCPGEKYSKESVSSPRLAGGFLTSDFDDMKVVGARSKVEGETEILGPSPASFTPTALNSRTGIISRVWYSTGSTTVTHFGSESNETAVCIPYLERNAVLYGSSHSLYDGNMTHSSGGYNSFADPYRYYAWTYHKLTNWWGSWPIMKGAPYPKDGNPIWVEWEEYNSSDSPCAGAADQGAWLSGFPSEFTGVPGIPEPNIPSVSFTEEGLEETTSKLYLGSTLVTEKLKNEPDPGYFAESPSTLLGVFRRDATRNVCGKAEYTVITEPFGGHTKWGTSSYADDKSIPRFIGVIHE